MRGPYPLLVSFRRAVTDLYTNFPFCFYYNNNILIVLRAKFSSVFSGKHLKIHLTKRSQSCLAFNFFFFYEIVQSCNNSMKPSTSLHHVLCLVCLVFA